MKFFVVKLRFKGPLHLSRGGLETNESCEQLLRSDTLHAALYVTALKLYGEKQAEQVLKQIVLSSAFPFSEEGYWLPRPLWFQPDDVENRKQLKKKRYLTFKQFQRLMLGDEVGVDELLATRDPLIWESTTTQRVLIDRVHNRGTPFFLEKLYPRSVEISDRYSKNNEKVTVSMPWHESQGLYVILAMADDLPWLDGVFKLLGENGIGLQRNLGNGHFEHEWAADFPDFQLPETSQIDRWVNLSLYRPTMEELNSNRLKLDKSSYRMVKRGGWIASPEHLQFATLRKKSVMMFEEGSAFHFSDLDKNEITSRGEIVNLRPDWNGSRLHPIWRSGKALFVPFSSY